MGRGISKVQLEGLTDVLANIHKLKQGMRNRFLRKALQAANKPIVKSARAFAAKRTGQLRKSLGSIVKTYGSGKVVAIIGARRGFKTEVKGRPVDPAKYAHLPELGRKAFDQKRGSSVVRIGAVAPSPFLKKSFDQHKQEAVDIIANVLTDEIAKAVSKGKL